MATIYTANKKKQDGQCVGLFQNRPPVRLYALADEITIYYVHVPLPAVAYNR